MISDINNIAVRLSDCQPIVTSEGYVLWYVTQNYKPMLYCINPYDLTNVITESVKYSFDSKTGTLTFSGTGCIKDYKNPKDRPWNEYASEIKSIVISGEVWRIGNNAFSELINLSEVKFGENVYAIGEQAFAGCSKLNNLVLPENIYEVGAEAFISTENLNNITILNKDTVFEWCAFFNIYGVKRKIFFAGDKTFENVLNESFDVNNDTIYYESNGPLIVNAEEKELYVNEVYKISANKENLSFISGDESVAAVDKNGIITAVSAGRAVITIMAPDGQKAEIEIIVKEKSTTTTTTTTTAKPTTTSTTTTTTTSKPATTTAPTTLATTKITTTTAVTTITETTPSEPKTLKGDVNKDGLVDIADATITLTMYASSAAGLDMSNYTEKQLKTADVDEDGSISINDATYILTYYANIAAGIDVCI